MIGDNVRAERHRRFWHQRDLAERTGWSRSAVSAIERGQRRVGPEELDTLCVVFGIGPARLVEGAQASELMALGLSW